ncbi:MAG: DUF4058 family protein [Gemmataceae bacterium]|nr:DUF4058 family protein [Gemmataceae bacterium]
MPLQDHFRPPLSARRHWHAFHNSWATYIASFLNERLPEGYFAEANVQFGIEIDVATFEEPAPPACAPKKGPATRGTAGSSWEPPKPVLTIPFVPAADVVEIQVFSNKEGPTLAGAIELVSPANKDRPASREAFISKCETYLHAGAGLILVDVVTEKSANLHNELLARLGGAAAPYLEADLYAAAYRPVKRRSKTNLDLWHEVLGIGRPLPTMPLCLRGGLILPVDLEATYDRTCREQRVGGNGA